MGRENDSFGLVRRGETVSGEPESWPEHPVNGKIFAFMSKGQLVVKLPGARVDELSAQQFVGSATKSARREGSNQSLQVLSF